jgi:hypothetical protein
MDPPGDAPRFGAHTIARCCLSARGRQPHSGHSLWERIVVATAARTPHRPTELFAAALAGYIACYAGRGPRAAQPVDIRLDIKDDAG